MFKFGFGLAILLLLISCGPSNKLAWEHYDECSVQNLGFVAMVECGKQKRTAWCEAQPTSCGAEGNAVVAYAGSLATSVERREMTEPEAQRRWIEFRSSQVGAVRQLAAQRAAAMPTTCTKSGSTMTCN